MIKKIKGFLDAMNDCFSYAEELSGRGSEYLNEYEPLWWKIPTYILVGIILAVGVPVYVVGFYIPMVIIGAIAKLMKRMR